jgi:hypothetical protein
MTTPARSQGFHLSTRWRARQPSQLGGIYWDWREGLMRLSKMDRPGGLSCEGAGRSASFGRQ